MQRKHVDLNSNMSYFKSKPSVIGNEHLHIKNSKLNIAYLCAPND